MLQSKGPIGIFDSGYGGLTVYKEIVKKLPQYDFIYLGDNARVPYGTRSFETVYKYTWECVQKLFELNCHLVILACNTASAKALRTIQQVNLPREPLLKKVLGVIRPTAEIAGKISKTGNIGIFATQGTVSSESYPIEIKKYFPLVQVFQEACPMWVPLVENDEYNSLGAEYFVEKNIRRLKAQCADIDTIILACTHYPILLRIIKKFVSSSTAIVSQGEIVAASLEDYLYRHPEVRVLCTKNAHQDFYTTDLVEGFSQKAGFFLNKTVEAKKIDIEG